MAEVPKEYIHSYVRSHIYVLTNDKKKYFGFFEGFSSGNNAYLTDCVEILDEGPSIEKSITKKLGTHLIPIFKIDQFLSHHLPSLSDTKEQIGINGKLLKPRQFCKSGHCESLHQFRSPLGGYIGPHRQLRGHVQNEPCCNCSVPEFGFGRYTTEPIPIATRTYTDDHFGSYKDSD